MANRSSEGERARGMVGSSRRVEPHGLEALIPGLPNEITMDLIVTKLPVADVLKLPLISPAWQQAVQTQEVRSARLRLRKAEFLSVVPVVDLIANINKIRLALHSSDYKFFGTLPPIPRVWTKNDQVIYRHLCFGGRIHVLVMNLRYSTIRTSVYTFDVTRGGQTWTESARSQVIIRKLDLETYRLQRQSRCCLKDNKFYVSGVLVPAGVGPGHIIYDPDLDSWSSTTNFQQEASTGRCICPSLRLARFLQVGCFV